MTNRPPDVGLTKLATGIKGFDEISEGGLPRGRTTLVLGGPGCGKTVFALQSLVMGARSANQTGILVACEESSREIIVNAQTFGWDLPALENKNLYFLDARLSPDVVQSGEFDLIGMLTRLEAKAAEIKATCVAFDGIDVLLALLDNPIAERREIYRVRDWLNTTGLTGIITQKVGGTEGDRHNSFLQFMSDCVIMLNHQVMEGSAFRSLRIVKYRGSSFSGDEFPISLTREGMQLTTRGPVELKYEVTDQRISTGLPRLDTMLCGGYYRGSNVLISGAPGTAKSTLAGLFAATACKRGERTLYVSFDEGAGQIVRNLRSVGIQLAPYLGSGLLKMYSTRTRGPNIEDQFAALRAQVQAHRPRCLVMDPLSALSNKLAHVASADAAQQFLDYLKGEGITVVNTSLLDRLHTDEATATGISTTADTWIHVSYVVQDGERNRALTIVKSRGTGHSNQVRELTLSNEGVSLTDVFMAHGKVLMGVARREWEQEEQAGRRRSCLAAEHKLLQLELGQTTAAAQVQVIETEMQARSAEIANLSATILTKTELPKRRKTGDQLMARAKPIKEDPEQPTVLAAAGRIVLRLYVAGNAANSLLALANLKALCDAHFTGCHEIRVIDLLHEPQQAATDGIIVTPTLLKLSPGPFRRVVGNLNDSAQVLRVLVNH